MRGAPQGSIQYNCKSGWMQKEIFVAWLKHFIQYTATTKENPCLLILDGHSTHTKSLELIDVARESGVTIVCLPPHCTHRMQPLDVTVMKPLSVGLMKASHKWMGENVGCTIGLYQIAEIFCKAYEMATTPSHLITGFRKCGLYPIDTKIFDGKFGAASVTDISATAETEISATTSAATATTETEGLSELEISAITSAATTSEVDNLPSSSGDNVVLPSHIRPVPQVDRNIEKKKRSGKNRSGKAVILTSSPYRNELTKDEEIEMLKQQLKETKSELKLSRKNLKGLSKTPAGASRKLFSTDKVKVKAEKVAKKKNKKKKNILLNVDDEVDNNQIPLPDADCPEPSLDHIDIELGQFVLVSFSGSENCNEENAATTRGKKSVFYVGYVSKKVSEFEVETKFLRRSDLKKTDTMKFTYPDEVDVFAHRIDRIVLFLPKPKQIVGKSKRLGSTLCFEDERLNNFSPVM